MKAYGIKRSYNTDGKDGHNKTEYWNTNELGVIAKRKFRLAQRHAARASGKRETKKEEMD